MTDNKNQDSIKDILADKWISAKVIKGKGRGKKIGFPTINLNQSTINNQQLTICFGVYLCKVEFPANFKAFKPEKQYFGLLHFGPPSTFNEKKPTLEIYILDFHEKIKIGTKIKFKILQFLRPTKKFKSAEELKKQIKKDVIKAKKIINIDWIK